MYNEETKRNNEHVWATVFITNINAIFDFDYYLIPERGEKSPVDMYAKSRSGKFKELKLQLTHAVELPFVNYEEAKSANYSRQPTIDAIERKYEKLHRQGANISELILVIQGYMNQDTACAVFSDESFSKYTEYPFAGIYYVAPYMLSGDSDESLQNGYIVAIKEAFTLASVG
jgi:hypothetical protein